MNKEQIIKNLEKEDPVALFKRADRLRRHFVGNDIHLRAMITISTFCERDCLFCPLRKSNKNIKRFRLPFTEIQKLIQELTRHNIRTVILESGQDSFYDGDVMLNLIKGIKKVDPAMAVTLFIGEHNIEDYRKWLKVYADRYVVKYEIANHKIFKRMIPDLTLEHKIQHIRTLQKVGFQVGTGFIVGLPGQTYSDIADNILLLKRIDPDLIFISVFEPNSNIPIKGESPDNELIMKTIALTRIVCKQAHIVAPNSIDVEYDLSMAWMSLETGANAVIIDFTPQPYKDYLNEITHRELSFESIKDAVNFCQNLAKNLGRRISTSRGDSLMFKNKRSPNKKLLPADLVTVKKPTPSQWLYDSKKINFY